MSARRRQADAGVIAHCYDGLKCHVAGLLEQLFFLLSNAELTSQANKADIVDKQNTKEESPKAPIFETIVARSASVVISLSADSHPARPGATCGNAKSGLTVAAHRWGCQQNLQRDDLVSERFIDGRYTIATPMRDLLYLDPTQAIHLLHVLVFSAIQLSKNRARAICIFLVDNGNIQCYELGLKKSAAC